MGQNKNIRWYLKHEEELREQYGAVEFPKDEYDKMMEYLDDNYGEID